MASASTFDLQQRQALDERDVQAGLEQHRAERLDRAEQFYRKVQQ